MSQDRTSGFDMLVQISENELNNQVAAAFASGLLLPPAMSSPVTAFGLTGRLDLNLGTPIIDLDRPRPQLGITTAFTNSQLEITAPISSVIAPLAGTIVIVDAVQMRTSGGTQQAVVDFTSGAPNVTVTFNAATVALLTPILAGLGVTIDMARNQLANIVRDQLVSGVQRLPMSPPIPVANDADPITPFSIDVTTVNDTSATDRDALTFGIRTDAGSGGNINGVTQSFIPSGSESVLMMSNFWLLARVVRPRLAAALGRPVSDFDTPLRLNRAVPAPGGRGTLTNLEARIEGNRIRVDGRATASGDGWSAVSTFTFFINLTLSGGQIQITATQPTVNTNVSLAWWVWLLGLGLGGLFGGIAGAIIGAIVLAIVVAVAEGIANRLASNAFNTATSSIPPVPLGPIGSGMAMTSIILDDLLLRGPIQRGLIPVKNTGSHVGFGPFAVDLDKGTVYSGTSEQVPRDLGWHPANGLRALNGAGLTISGQSYGALTPVQLRSMSFATTQLAASAVPLSADLPFFGVSNQVVFGVRTNEGRLAKVRAWRDLVAGGALRIFWTTYDTPIPALDIALRWSVLEKSEESTLVPGPDFSTCSRYEVSRRCMIEAWPRLVSFPVDYRWCLCGQVLEEGEGEVQHAGGTISYELAGRYLTLETGVGDALDCELCVSAIDARNRELFSCVQLKQGSSDTHCTGGRKFYPKPKLDIIPCDPLISIDTWEPVISQRFNQHLVAALERTGKKAAGAVDVGAAKRAGPG